jgi:hypothetical protein
MNKEFWKSKTFWGSVLIALGVVGNYLNGNIDFTGFLTGIGTAFGLFGVRDALK